jgi:hypothetical protein
MIVDGAHADRLDLVDDGGNHSVDVTKGGT